MAVLAGLYLVQPWPKLLADLTPQQQVQAAVLADMWQLPAASEAAVAVLQEATGNASDASAVLEQLFSLPAVPDCLSQVLEQAVVGKFGDLEAVWGPDGASLQESLLALPLHAMELLLASDKLKVCREGASSVLSTWDTPVVKLRQWWTVNLWLMLRSQCNQTWSSAHSNVRMKDRMYQVVSVHF
jgi:hypothetical protein